MLRRPATSIKLTPEDILEYDDALELQHQEEVLKSEQQLNDVILQEQVSNSSEVHYKPESTVPPHQLKTRDDRIRGDGR